MLKEVLLDVIPVSSEEDVSNPTFGNHCTGDTFMKYLCLEIKEQERIKGVDRVLVGGGDAACGQG